MVEPPLVPTLLAVLLASAGAGLLLFSAVHAQGMRMGALAAERSRVAARNGPAAPCPGGVGGGGSGAAAAAAGGGGLGAAARRPDPALQLLLETRICGSPALDGYAHVNASCLMASPTARWYSSWVAAGGDPSALVAHLEPAADVDGIAVKWGIGNKHATPEACARDCWAHRPNTVEGPFQGLPCNAFSWCGADACFEPDAHNHTRGDCWLKWAEAPASPELNMRGDLPAEYRARHPTAPARVQWVAGVLLPPGVAYTNGSWGPRWWW